MCWMVPCTERDRTHRCFCSASPRSGRRTIWGWSSPPSRSPPALMRGSFWLRVYPRLLRLPSASRCPQSSHRPCRRTGRTPAAGHRSGQRYHRSRTCGWKSRDGRCRHRRWRSCLSPGSLPPSVLGSSSRPCARCPRCSNVTGYLCCDAIYWRYQSHSLWKPHLSRTGPVAGLWTGKGTSWGKWTGSELNNEGDPRSRLRRRSKCSSVNTYWRQWCAHQNPYCTVETSYNIPRIVPPRRCAPTTLRRTGGAEILRRASWRGNPCLSIPEGQSHVTTGTKWQIANASTCRLYESMAFMKQTLGCAGKGKYWHGVSRLFSKGMF